MFPIRDHNPSGRTPYVTYALILANVAIFALYTGALAGPEALNRFYMTWALIPAEVTSGQGWVTFLSSMFLHGGLMHLAGNMLFLWIFGDNLEDEMGHMPFLGFYLASGIGAGLIHVLAAPYSPVPTVGASGAIAGVMGGYLLLFPKARVDILLILVIFFKVFPVPAWLMLGLWFAFQFLGGWGADPNAGGVAYWAHAGGFVIGFALCLPLWARLGGFAFWTRTHGLPPHPQATYRMSRTRIPKVPRRR
ncbi:rhomboid family intramembrane serine protease [Marinibacterium profundimaris]|uniref:Peptidase C54 n=1 Tax=Marinibacterium profundimaris TaxID=1679460 RepID=A0A225NCJ4_9RHOB|nr:rhomboid family intramembrane serine protease [Marinibacterium profundimaris]OWU69004.1 peptidase C54 [Marinibacterium profundimaris]